MNIPVVVDTAVIVPINVAPLVDDTDFKSIEASVAYNASGLTLVWNFVTPAGVVTQTAVTPTDTGGNYDWQNKGNGMYAIEIPASGGASINNDTEGVGYFTGVATGVLPWRGPNILFAPAHVVNGLVTGSDNLQIDAVQWGGSATPVTNINTIYNTDYATVYDTTNKAFLSKLGNFAMGGSSLALTTGAIACTTITASGAVAFQSTFAVTTSTSLGALSATTVTASGAVAFQSTFAVTGATTLTGAVTASNASNNIVGIDVAKISGDSTAADNAEAFFDGTGYAGTNNVIPLVTTTTNLTNAATNGDLTATMKASVNTEVDTALADYDAPTSAELVSEINSVQSDIAALNNLSSAQVIAAFQTGGIVVNSTTIATLASQTSFTLTAGSADNDAYNGCRAVIIDASTATQRATAIILDYTGATKTVTLKADPGIFTIATGDTVVILPPALVPTTLGNTLDVTATGGAGIDWGNVENATTTVGLSGTTIKTATDVETDTADIQSRLPAALVSGRMDASVGAMASNVITAAATNPDFIAEINAECDTAISDALNSIADTVLTRNVSNVEGTAPTNASLAFVILAMRHNDTTSNPGKITVFKTTGAEFVQIDVTSDPSAEPITEVG